MWKSVGLNAFLFLSAGWPLVGTLAQEKTGAKADYSNEAFILDQFSDKFKFQNDGTSTRETTMRALVQSDAGVQQLGVLKFSYQSSSESFVVDYVRVRKPDNSLIVSPAENFQDMPADVTRQAPFYSDIQEKHVAVRGLGPGDVLEYKVHWQRTKPVAPGQFWLAYNFEHDGIVLAEEVEVSVPREREIKLKSPAVKPSIRDEGQFRIYNWKTTRLEHKAENKQKQDEAETAQQAARGQFPQPDLQLSTYKTWDEVGRWYADLQRDRVKPSTEIQAKANELTNGMSDDAAKIQALYNFVSTRYRYIGIALGVGRYQPHSATEVLQNQYGDCKDKHTLLASLLRAVGLTVYPALISTDRDIDAEVPSPGQFDHVVTVVRQGNGLVWLDSTAGVGPFGYLVPVLRDKHALVIGDDKPAELVATPADPPYRALQVFQMAAKLNDNGTLEGKVEYTVRGDREILLRAAFRAVQLSQWKELVQQVSFGAGFGGEVSESSASAPEKTDEPFHISYSYKRKDYSDWPNRRISAPLPLLAMPDLDTADTRPRSGIWLGAPGEIQSRAQVELPKGYVPQLQRAVHLKQEFAEYDATYAVKNGVLSAERRLVIKARLIAPSAYEEYKKFREAVEADYTRFTILSSAKNGGAPSYLESVWELPNSNNPEAEKAYDDARNEVQKNNMPGAVASLRHAVDIDPNFARGWLWLGEIYKFTGETEPALRAYQKALEVAPQEPVAYKALGFALMGMTRFEEAISVWRDLGKTAPDDADGPANLANCLNHLKRYQEAAAALESVMKIDPDRAGLLPQLGLAYLRSGNDEKALAVFRRAIEGSASATGGDPEILNGVAYSLAEENKYVPLALQYAEKAVQKVEEESNKIDVSQLEVQNLAVSNRLAAYWDTLGWVHFRNGNLDKAERYLIAGWTMTQAAVSGDHLAQVYEKLGKKQQAAHTYRLALQMMGRNGDPQMRARLKVSIAALSSGAKGAPAEKAADVQLSEERTQKLPKIHDWGGGYKSAEFVIALTKESGVAGTKFLSGAEELKGVSGGLADLRTSFPFPDGSHARILRRGVLSCSEIARGCVFVFYPADIMAAIPVGIPADKQ